MSQQEGKKPKVRIVKHKGQEWHVKADTHHCAICFYIAQIRNRVLSIYRNSHFSSSLMPIMPAWNYFLPLYKEKVMEKEFRSIFYNIRIKFWGYSNSQ